MVPPELKAACIIIICVMTVWLYFRARKLYSQFRILNVVYVLGILLVITYATIVLNGPQIKNMYYNYSHKPEPEQIASNPMRELLAGETTRVLDNRGFGYIPGDIVIINGDTAQIRPGDCILFDWQRALRSGRLGACLGGYGPWYSIVKVINVPGDSISCSVPASEGYGDRVFRISSSGQNVTNSQGVYKLASNEYVIDAARDPVTPGVILITSALIHSRIVMKIGHDAASAKEFSQRVY